MKKLLLLSLLTIISLYSAQAQQKAASEVRTAAIYFAKSIQIGDMMIAAGTQIIPGPKGSKGIIFASDKANQYPELINFKAKDRPVFIDGKGNIVIHNPKEPQLFTDNEGDPVMVASEVVPISKAVLKKFQSTRSKVKR